MTRVDDNTFFDMRGAAEADLFEKTDLLNKEVEKYTPSRFTTFLAFAIPAIGWAIGWIYFRCQSKQRLVALEKLELAYRACRRIPFHELGPNEELIYLAAKKSLEKYGYPSASKDHFQREVRKKITDVFGEDLWESKDFEHKVFPIYLALAQKSREEEEDLIAHLPQSILAALPEGTIDRDKIVALRTTLQELESQIEKQPKVLACLSSDQNSKNAVHKCIKREILYSLKIYNGTLDPKQYFEELIKDAVVDVFGMDFIKNPTEATNLLHVYLPLALELRKEEIEFISNIQALQLPDGRNIDPLKIVALHEKLETLTQLYPSFGIRLCGRNGIEYRPVQGVTELLLKRFPPTGSGTFLTQGQAISTLAKSLYEYWKDPKYTSDYKKDIFEMALILSVSNPETLDTNLNYVKNELEGESASKFREAFAQAVATQNPSVLMKYQYDKDILFLRKKWTQEKIDGELEKLALERRRDIHMEGARNQLVKELRESLEKEEPALPAAAPVDQAD